MEYTLGLSESVKIGVKAREYCSSSYLAVKASQVYHIKRSSERNWWDLWVSCGPNGYTNLLAAWLGLRLPKANCFALCGAYNQSDENSFYIGTDKEVNTLFDGRLYFFANDTKGFYWNNFGSIDIMVTRIA